MKQKLHKDLETFSSVDIMTAGAYKYTESVDFEILILCYALNDEPVKTIDLAAGEEIPQEFIDYLYDDDVELHAHNANFERLCFKAIGIDIPIWRWHCSAVKAGYCGYPLALGMVSEAMKLEEKGKLTTGKALIRFFSCPVKATKANGMRVRNFWYHDLEKWEEYKRYCGNDVEAEREIGNRLEKYNIPDMERILYILDQEINDRGILIDLQMAYNATQFNNRFVSTLTERLIDITGLDNPNSPAQLKQWLTDALGKDITTLAKDNILTLISETEAGEDLDYNYDRSLNENLHNINYTEKDLPNLGYQKANLGGWLHQNANPLDFYGSGYNADLILERLNKPKQLTSNAIVNEVLKLRQMSAKTSIKKYFAMLACACYDNRAHGLFQFYGANRTGRWAGRLIQLQNLPQNHLDLLEYIRSLVANNDYDTLEMMFENISDVLSQLIRTTFVAKPGHTFAIADFSAIEARVIAWLANELWRLEVFETHGKIYEASAAMMFNLEIESIKKGSPERDKGKVAELALGYGGSLGALRKMGGEKMGLSDPEMEEIVRKWRLANPQIVKLWKAVENAAIQAIRTHKPVVLPAFKNLLFEYDGDCLMITLPSGRKLFYQQAMLTINKWGKVSIKYKGVDQITKKWWWVDTYGGKLIENIIQAIARDCLGHSMLLLNENGFKIVIHVHDEAGAEVPIENSDISLEKMCYLMGLSIPWAPGLRLTADGYTTPFYKKD